MSPSSERTVRLPADLHARPAGLLSRTAAGFESKVTFATPAKEVDARSVLLVMALGATEGTEVTVRATGRDAEAAVERLSGMLEVIRPIQTAEPARSEESPAPALDGG
jgi:phosphotransferase system HPr (HPr) family protein